MPSFEYQTEPFLCFIKVSLVLTWKMVLSLVGRVWDRPKKL